VLTGTSRHVIHQAAWLAHRFHAEMILLHVVTPFNYPAGMLEGGHEITVRDLPPSLRDAVNQAPDR